MWQEKQIKDTLDRILDSKTFSKSTTTNVLLKFLVESTIQKKVISSFSIGEELFGSRYDPEKSDVNIRVNISHLRKRLRHYYENEGANENLIISIKPGQYYASFSPAKQKRKRKYLLGVVLALSILIGAAIFVLFNKNKDFVWASMLQNDFETTLYLGDEFGYYGPTPMGYRGWNRDAEINTVEEFYAHTKQNPGKYAEYQPLELSYIVFDNAYTLKPFTHYFTLTNYDFSVRPVSDFKTKSIKDRNTVYAGNFYTQSSMNNLFNDLSKRVYIDNESFQQEPIIFFDRNNKNEESVYVNSRTDEGEYALAAGFNGPNGTRHHLFFSNHGLGVGAVVEYFTNTDSIKAFSNKYLYDSDEFICLFFVKGKDRTSMSMEMVHFDGNK